MNRTAMPHEGFNPDGATLPDGASVPVYDWMSELIQQNPKEPWVLEKLAEYGWDEEAFLNYRNWLVNVFKQKYHLSSDQDIIKELMLGRYRPVWNRTNPNAKAPLGWFDTEDEVMVTEPEIPQPEVEPIAIRAWVHSTCFKKNV